MAKPDHPSMNNIDSSAPRIPWLLSIFLIGQAAAPLAHGQALELDPARSHIEVSVAATGDSFVARLEKYQARIALRESTLTPLEAKVIWNFTDLKTGKAKRDTAMLDWLENDKTPQGSFVMQRWETREKQTWAVGQVAFHGITNALAMPVTITREKDQIHIRGEAELDYTQYQLKIIRMMLFFTVDPKVKVSIDLQGRLTERQP